MLLLKNEDFVLYYDDLKSLNFVPFLTIATLIEDYLYKYISFGTIMSYLLQEIFLFLPYGFYVILLLHNFSRIVRFFALLLLPVIIELVQKIFLLGKPDIDDIILGLIGGLIGGLCYHLLNRIFLYFTDENFLFERNRYSFSNRFRYH
jgi:glycopeptide antibiotics resistance protein